MKMLRLGAILTVMAAATFGCSDDDAKDGARDVGAAGSGADGAAGDGAGGAEGEPASLELIGEYDDNFGGEQIITATTWNTSAIIEYDNDANVVYTRYPDDDQYNPGKFAKTVYTEPKDGSFYFCMIEYSLDSLDDAKASEKTADDSDPESVGCGNFSWSKATAK